MRRMNKRQLKRRSADRSDLILSLFTDRPPKLENVIGILESHEMLSP
jgi:hypothetical protein